MRRDYMRQKRFQIVEMWECEKWSLRKTDASVKSDLSENFPSELLLSSLSFLSLLKQILQWIIDGTLLGYVQCDIEVPQHLQRYFSNFSPTFQNTVVSGDDIGTLMRKSAEKGKNLAQPRRMLVSSFYLTNEALIISLLLFHLKLGLVCEKFHRFVQNIPNNVSTPSYSLTWMHGVKDKKNQIPVLSPNSETASQQVICVSDNGLQLTHCDKVFKRWKIRQCKKLKNVQASQSLHWWIVRSWTGEVWNWAQRTNHCWVFYSIRCQAENVGTLLQFLQKVLRR